ncbi:hypothetical protein DVH05_020720 [Phytophthora capsici]|nr:hypothetical protein DVH05_020720 [Phytophthora capsici]
MSQTALSVPEQRIATSAADDTNREQRPTATTGATVAADDMDLAAAADNTATLVQEDDAVKAKLDTTAASCMTAVTAGRTSETAAPVAIEAAMANTKGVDRRDEHGAEATSTASEEHTSTGDAAK